MEQAKNQKELLKIILEDDYELSLERDLEDNNEIGYYLSNSNHFIKITKRLALWLEELGLKLENLTEYKYYHLETNYGSISVRSNSKIGAIDEFHEMYNDGEIYSIGE